MLTRRLLLSAAFPALAAFHAARAADDETPKSPVAIFDTVFPRPTGANGMEEIIRAGEGLRSGGIEQKYLTQYPFTLTKKREYVALPACREAIVLLRRGVSKPVAFPATAPDDDDFTGFASLRAVARLLSVAIAVAFADGRTVYALQLADYGLIYALPLKSVSFAASITGISVEAVVLTAVLRHKEGLTVADCRRLRFLMERSLALPDVTESVLGLAKIRMLKTVAVWRDNPAPLCTKLTEHFRSYDEYIPPPGGSPHQDQTQYQQALQYAEQLKSDPMLREQVVGEMSAVVSEHFDRAATLARDPTGVMSLAPKPNDDANRHPMIPLLRDAILLDPHVLIVKNKMAIVNFQLVAVHAAIRGYRWENDRLPESLADLSLSESLIADLFTGDLLVYKLDEARTGYELYSAGALLPGTPARRERITFPWTKPP